MNEAPTPETESTANLETELARLEANTKAWLERDNEPDNSHWQTIAIQHRRERDEWKAKYIQQNKDLGCEMMDPNGTIWDHAKKLQRELAEAREYADTLVAHKDMICLPKDLEVLREANLGLAMELYEAQNEIIGWKNKWDCAVDMAARAENARDEMTLRWERTNDALFEARELTKRQGEIIAEMMTPAEQRLSELEIALAIERALADRLALALKMTRWDSPVTCKAALEAWKEARK
jgi:hypothetical protein